MKHFIKPFPANLILIVSLMMFAFTSPKNNNLGNVAIDAKPLHQPNDEYCFSAESEGYIFYMIVDIQDDGNFTGVVAASDGENINSLSLEGYIDGMDMYITDEDGDESIWTINGDGVVASDGTQFYEEDCDY